VQKAEAQRRKVHLSAALPSDPIMIVADVGRLMQVLVNLVTNAINYTPENGDAAISVTQINKGVRIDVSDTGIGIASENLSRIFDPFFRASEGTARGTGLGLSISKEIIGLHGGTLTAESTLGEGSTFHIWLPLDGKPEAVLSG
jgi:signal transduction histidine kinase